MIKLICSSIVPFLLVMLGLSGCSKQNIDQLDLENGLSAINAEFPHPKNWKGKHMSAILTRKSHNKLAMALDKSSSAGSHESCIQCHKSLKGKPLNVSCATACHTRGPGGNPSHLPKPGDSKCLPCHDKLVQNKFDHYPSGVGLCETCHTADTAHLAGEAGTVTTNKKAENCYQCHFRQDTGAVLHGALKDDESCISCHNPHGSKNRYFLQEETTQALCNTCHSVATETVSKHAPAVQGKACLNCHNPHSAPNKKLLLKPSRELCLSCHDRPIRGTLNGNRMIPDIKAKVESASQHTGAQGACTDCHDAHASDYSRLLIDNYSTSIYNTYPQTTNPYAVCFSCHSDSMLKQTGFEGDTNFRDTAKGVNVHWFHVVDAAGNTDKTRGRSCKICHDPHGSPQAFNINSTWRMGERDIRIEYTQLSDGGQCAKTCHTARIYKR
ncbi:MAG: hypothetical protein A2X86_10095 [Bdellovibrionales bacterium GWA2_49_15]|nr:MAG: hypothetical protein A2X86_10095 [Bdellovibrionales bacterium GWA2_49_15]HAZ14232.1 hypothetical protein [Bdellovibrionales bacterium]